MAHPGWYPDPQSAAMRYWDGQSWTTHQIEPMSDAERRERMQAAVTHWVARGARVESLTDYQAVLIVGNNINNVAHLLGCLFTCGLWLIGYVIAIMTEKPERRVVLRVDRFGQVVGDR